EFESFAHVKPPFFKYDLSLLSTRNAVVVSADPEIRILVGFPSGSENILFFDIKLTFNDENFTDHFKSVPLELQMARFFPIRKPAQDLCSFTLDEFPFITYTARC
ncbi:unnamed protein product, partial [Dibothriocephalus latus]